MITVQAQTLSGEIVHNQSTNVLTRREIISDAVDVLFATGGVIRCHDPVFGSCDATGEFACHLYRVAPYTGFAVQDDEQEWIE